MLLLSRRQLGMSQRPHLPNAPITEAVLDIQVELPANVKLGQLEAMHRDIRDRYPNRRTRKRIEGTVNVKPEGEVRITAVRRCSGPRRVRSSGRRAVIGGMVPSNNPPPGG